jgi:hypothetical protein
MKSFSSPHNFRTPFVEMLMGIFQSKELIEGADGKLVLGSRPIGTNKIGMLAKDSMVPYLTAETFLGLPMM